MTGTVTEAARALLAADNILILTHRRPDGDTTGCAGALCRGLRQLGKTAYILENVELTRRYEDLIAPCYAPADFAPACVVTTDIADYGLLTDNAEPYRDRLDVVLDHHRSNAMAAPVRVVRETAGACAELIADVLDEMGVELTADIAECLYIALSTDTGCFRYSNTTPDTLRIAARCLEAGVDGGEINRRLFEVKSWPRFQMERIIFDTMEFLMDGKIALVIIRRTDINRTGADMDDLDSIASLTRQIEGVQVGITITENTDGTSKISVRTTKEVDASAICAKCGGGGHLRAGGASLSCGPDEARDQIVEAARQVYAESELA